MQCNRNIILLKHWNRVKYTRQLNGKIRFGLKYWHTVKEWESEREREWEKCLVFCFYFFLFVRGAFLFWFCVKPNCSHHHYLSVAKKINSKRFKKMKIIICKFWCKLIETFAENWTTEKKTKQRIHAQEQSNQSNKKIL